MNYSDILTSVRDYINEPTAKNWEDVQLERFINRMHEQLYSKIVMAGEQFFATTTCISMTANQELYTLPTDCLRIYQIERKDLGTGNVTRKINPIPFNERNTRMLRDDVVGYDSAQMYYYLFGSQIGLTPIPASSYTNNITLYYAPTATTLTGTVEPFNGELDTFHDLVALGAAIKARARERLDYSDLKVLYNELYKDFQDFLPTRQEQEAKYINYIGDEG